MKGFLITVAVATMVALGVFVGVILANSVHQEFRERIEFNRAEIDAIGEWADEATDFMNENRDLIIELDD